MNDVVKGHLTRSEEQYDRERFAAAIRAVRSQLDDLEIACAEDVVFRDTVTVACESIHLQLALLNRHCDMGSEP